VISGVGFLMGPMPLLSPNQQQHNTDGDSITDLSELLALPFSHRPHQSKDGASFLPALW